MPRHMRLFYNDPKYWRARAIEVRTVADRTRNPESRYRMLVIAGRYQEIAERARGTLSIVPDDGDID